MHVTLETNHGAYELEGLDGDTIRSVLERFNVPLSAVWTYSLEAVDQSAGARRVHFVPASDKLRDLDEREEAVFARVTRNINLPALLALDATTVRPVERPTTEWVFPGRDGGAFDRVEAQLTAQECFDIVCESVDSTLESWPSDLPDGLVVGTSGGGDSNVLLSALMKSPRLPTDRVLPVMMLGIPDWDTQLGNARQICEAVGLELQVIEADDAARLAGVKSFDALKSSFTKTYPDADLEFLGTWLLRKVLGAYAHERGLGAVATGANREDIVAEGFARLARGQAPLPSPYRRIGDVTFVYPIHQVPKKIGDGAYPTLSLENYEARNASFSPGRSLFYWVAYQLADAAPGIDQTLLDGFSKLAAAQQTPFVYDDQIGDYIVAEASTEEQRSAWSDFVKQNALTS